MSKAIVKLVDGLQLNNTDSDLYLTYDHEFLIITEKKFQGFKSIDVNIFKIPFHNIIDTVITTDKELIEKDKSVLGRGIVGGLVFGPAGLILGGLSGIGKKSKFEKNYFYIVSFVGSDTQIKNITFTMTKMMVSVADKFNTDLSRALQRVPKSPEVLKYLPNKTGNSTIL